MDLSIVGNLLLTPPLRPFCISSNLFRICVKT